MKFTLRSLLCFLAASVPLGAEDWSPEALDYEKTALENPGKTLEFWRIRDYVRETGKTKEWKQRWEEKATGPDELKYRLAGGVLAAATFDRPKIRSDFKRALELDPQNLIAWRFLAEAEWRDRTEVAQETIQKAVQIEQEAGAPGEALETLCRFYVKQKIPDDMRLVVEKSIPKILHPALRSRIVRLLAANTFKSGDLPGFISNLEKAVSTGDVIAVADLANVYVEAADFTMAARTIKEGLVKFADNKDLPGHVMEIVRSGKIDDEILALLLSELPKEFLSPMNRAELFRWAIERKSTANAKSLIKAHGADIALSSSVWREAIPEIRSLELSKETLALLQKHSDQAGWEGFLALGELQAGEGNLEEAEKSFWKLLDPALVDRSYSVMALGIPGMGKQLFEPTSRGIQPGGTFNERIRHIYFLTVIGPPILQLSKDSGERRKTPLLIARDARDLALVYLALIAEKSDKQNEFLDKLKPLLAGREIAQRIFAYISIPAAKPLVAEIQTYRASGQTFKILDEFLDEQLRRLTHKSIFDGEDLTKLHAVLPKAKETGTAPANTSDSAPAPDSGSTYLRIWKDANEAFGLADFDKAAEVAGVAIGHASSNRAATAQYMERWAFKLIKFHDPQQIARGSVEILKALKVYAGANEKAENFPKAKEAIWGGNEPIERGSVSTNERSKAAKLGAPEGGWRAMLVFPPALLFSETELWALWGMYTASESQAAWAVTQKALTEYCAGLKDGEILAPGVATAYLQWWHGEYDSAIAFMKRVIEATKNDNVRIALVGMLRKQQRWSEADDLLKVVKPLTPAFDRVIKTWRLILAAEAKNAGVVSTLTKEIGGEELDAELIAMLSGALKDGGFASEAGVFEKREILTGIQRGAAPDDAAILKELMNSKDVSKQIAGAEKILADKPQLLLREDEKFRREVDVWAWKILDQHGKRDAYIAKLDQQLKSSPTMELWVRRAFATKVDDETTKYLKNAFEMEQTLELAQALLMRTMPENPERQRYFEWLLNKDPGDTVHRFLESTYTSYYLAGNLDRLAEVLSKVKLSPGRTINMSLGYNRAIFEAVIEAVGDTDVAVGVTKNVLALKSHDSPEFLKKLILLLLKLDRKPEAVEAYLAAIQNMPLLRIRVSLQELELLRLAIPLGVEVQVREILQKLPPEDKVTQSLFYLRALMRDPALPGEAPGYLSDPKVEENQHLINNLDYEFAQWPEAAGLVQGKDDLFTHWRAGSETEAATVAFLSGKKDLAVKMLRHVATEIPKIKNKADAFKTLLSAMEVAAKCDDPTLVDDICLCTGLEMERLKDILYGVHPSLLLDILAGADKEGKGRQLLVKNLKDFARKRPGNRHIFMEIAALDARRRLLTGDTTLATPIAWQDGSQSTVDSTVVCWNLGGFIYEASGIKALASLPIDLEALDGRYDCELFFGENEYSMRGLAKLEKVKAAGKWEGKLPKTHGYVRLVFTGNNQFMISPATEVWAADGLLKSPDSPWKGNQKTEIQSGGPQPETKSLHVLRKAYAERLGAAAARPLPTRINEAFPANGKGPNYGYAFAGARGETYQNNITGPRVKIRKGFDYVASGWIRKLGSGAEVGWIFLDAEEKPISQETASDSASKLRNGWARSTRHFCWEPDHDIPQEFLIPAQAAFIEPYVNGATEGCELSGFSILEIPQVAAE